MWLVACLAGLPDNALAGLGPAELAECKQRWGADFESMQMLRGLSPFLTVAPFEGQSRPPR